MFGLVDSPSKSKKENKIKVYIYHPDTHEHINTVEMSSKEYARQIEGGGCVTHVEPSKGRDYKDNWKINVFDVENNCWNLVENYRGFRYNKDGNKIDTYAYRPGSYNTTFSGYYLPLEGDEPGSPLRFNKHLGPVPEDAVYELPDKEEMIKRLNNENFATRIGEISSVLSNCSFRISKCGGMHVFYSRYFVVEDGRVDVKPCIDYSQLLFEISQRIDILRNAGKSDLSLKLASIMLNKPEQDTLEYVNNVLTEIDKINTAYFYFSDFINNCCTSYKEIYIEYKKSRGVIDYNKIRLELGIG